MHFPQGAGGDHSYDTERGCLDACQGCLHPHPQVKERRVNPRNLEM
jgi:hypothetical protein